eukprot:scaffold7613_cov37-Prasinocladus_malaysianus.AAC.2
MVQLPSTAMPFSRCYSSPPLLRQNDDDEAIMQGSFEVSRPHDLAVNENETSVTKTNAKASGPFPRISILLSKIRSAVWREPSDLPKAKTDANPSKKRYHPRSYRRRRASTGECPQTDGDAADDCGPPSSFKPHAPRAAWMSGIMRSPSRAKRPAITKTTPADEPIITPGAESKNGFDAKYVRVGFLGKGASAQVYLITPRHDNNYPGSVVSGIKGSSATSQDLFACKEIFLKTSSGRVGRQAPSPPYVRENYAGGETMIRQDDATTLEQAINELEILKNLPPHPNLVGMHEYFFEGNTCKVVMELLSGGELQKAITERGNLPEEDARGVMEGLLRGVRHLHDHGIVHRDLKLENIVLVDKKSTSDVKIVDLGLAKKIRMCESGGRELPAEHTICGSPLYLAPEMINPPTTQLPDGSKSYSSYGFEADLWACG